MAANEQGGGKAAALDIIIPVFNEKDSIASTLDEIYRHVTVPFKVYIVYDFDEDNTVPVVEAYRKEHALDSLKLVKNTIGRGVLNALKTGLQTSTADYMLVVMGDLSDDLSIFPQMAEKMKEGYDVICGSRYVKGGRQIGGPLLKKTMSRAAGISLHYLTGIPTRDVSNNFKLYSRRLIESIEIESKGGFEIAMEITVKAHAGGFRIVDIPSTWRDRSAGESNFNMRKWLPEYLGWYFYLVKKSWFG